MFSGGLGWGGGPNSLVKSVQHFEITISAGALEQPQAITAVDTTKSIILLNGIRSGEVTLNYAEDVGAVLFTSGTEVKAVTNSANGSSSRIFSVCIVEFWPWACEVVHKTATLGPGVSGNSFPTELVNPSVGSLIRIHCGSITDNATQNMASCVTVLNGTQSGNTLFGVKRNSSTGTVITYVSLLRLNPGIIKAAIGAGLFSSFNQTYSSPSQSLIKDNSILIPLGFATTGFQTSIPKQILINSTDIAIANGGGGGGEIYLSAFEFYPKWIKQRFEGEATIGLGEFEKDTAIPAVDLNKTLITMTGFNCSTAPTNMNTTFPTIYPSSATNVKAQRGSTSASNITTVPFNGIEFK